MPSKKSLPLKCHLLVAASFSATLATGISQPVLAQSCSGAADIWFANDESDSVDTTEFPQALDFLYKVSDEFVFDATNGAQAAVFGWSESHGPFDYVLPATATFGDTGDSGFFDGNEDGVADDSTVSVDGDIFGIRELYQERTYNGGTWLAKATNDLASRIGDTTDTDADGTTDNGRRAGVAQIAVLITDANAFQLTTIGEGGSLGNRGGADWDAAIANLVATAGGTELVLMLVDEAAQVYGTFDEVSTFINGLVTDYNIQLVLGDSYAALANSSNSFITDLANTICELTHVVTRVTAPSSFTTSDPVAITITFSEDITNFDANDVTVSNATLGNFTAVSPSQYSSTITPDGSQLDITLSIAAGVALSGNGRSNGALEKVITFDTDGDGVGDSDEGTVADTDNDGIPNFLDLDSDNDGISDIIENSSEDGEETDTDGDGTPDFLDIDSDNDGIPDSVEAFTTAPTFSGLDTDADGIDDALDADNGGPAEDLNSNGISDVFEPIDTDSDGIPDYLDLDSDNDSLTDIIEAGGVDSDDNALVDTPAAQGTLVNPIDSDGDGLPDYRDLQSNNANNDGSGAFDIDVNPTAEDQSNSATRDGMVDNNTDADQDGLANVADTAPGDFGGVSDPNLEWCVVGR